MVTVQGVMHLQQPLLQISPCTVCKSNFCSTTRHGRTNGWLSVMLRWLFTLVLSFLSVESLFGHSFSLFKRNICD